VVLGWVMMVGEGSGFFFVVSFMSFLLSCLVFFLLSLLLLGITKEVGSLHCVSNIICIPYRKCHLFSSPFDASSMSFLSLY
jgi:hypothetical protein